MTGDEDKDEGEGSKHETDPDPNPDPDPDPKPTLTPRHPDPNPPLIKKKNTPLVQSKLTSAFFRPVVTSAAGAGAGAGAGGGGGGDGGKSPYFTKATSYYSSTGGASSAEDKNNNNNNNNNNNTSVQSSIKSRRAPAPAPPPPPPSLPSTPSTTRSTLLSLVAAETNLLLPSLLSSAPHAPPTGHLYRLHDLPPLSPSACPQLPPTGIEVRNADSIDVALALALARVGSFSTSSSPSGQRSAHLPSALPPPPVLILNMANAQHSGGGWLRGALAQEESLCYRSSLSFTLKRRFYPLPDTAAVYSPSVLVLRESLAAGHTLLDLARPRDLPVVSVVSVAAVRDPPVVNGQGEFGGYRRAADRALMKEKMRIVLRVAATRRHRMLVLGALGCGAFGNPRGEVVACWGEVLAEWEFRGGWWERVVFAVMEEGGEREGAGNFGVFWRGLNGVEV